MDQEPNHFSAAGASPIAQWKIDFEELPDGRSKIVVQGTAAQWQQFGLDLIRQVRGKSNEVRQDFPGGWTLYWKWRSSESRFLVAHPETQQWVGTLALSDSVLSLLESGLFVGVHGRDAGLIFLNEWDGGYALSNLAVYLEVL